MSRARVLSQITTPEKGLTALALVLWGDELAPPSWQADAACVGTPWVWWDDDFEQRHLTTRERNMRAMLCAGCPVRVECGQHAADYEATSPWSDVPHGYVAGTTHGARRRVKHERSSNHTRFEQVNRAHNNNIDEVA